MAALALQMALVGVTVFPLAPVPAGFAVAAVAAEHFDNSDTD
jgi:hypothetical protein